MFIPVKKDIPSEYLCQCFYDSYEIYKAPLYTYVKKYTYQLNDNNEAIPDETIKKFFWWPMNDWKKINSFVIGAPLAINDKNMNTTNS